MPKPINNLVIVSDTHCGDQYGLCPSGGVRLDGGGIYTPSLLQLAVWSWWQEFWGEWVPEVCHGEPFAVVMNGDAIEHRHHNATHQISQNLSDQARIAEAVLRPVVDLCEGRFYFVRGTEAHAGQSSEDEERLAEKLEAIPDAIGNRTRYELRMLVGGTSRVHLMHHIGTTGTTHYESTAILKELVESYVQAGTWRQEPYDAVVRSHRHTFMLVTRPSRKGYAFSFTTAGWQLKTPFSNKIPGARQATPQFGGSILRQGDEDFYSRHFVRSIDPPREVVL